jgi:hypothetical protein
MTIKLIEEGDIRYLEQKLSEKGKVRCLAWKQLRRIPQIHIQQWCVLNGVYQIPTKELIAWLRDAIAGRPAIEICAGRSCLGRHLGIPMTDSYLHTQPDMLRHYRRLGQQPTIPDQDVLRMEALEAIRKLEPKVVIAAWPTQLYEEPDRQSSIHGVNEEELLTLVDTYIVIGNLDVHGKKRILKKPHVEYIFPLADCQKWRALRKPNLGLGKPLDPLQSEIPHNRELFPVFVTIPSLPKRRQVSCTSRSRHDATCCVATVVSRVRRPGLTCH